MRPDSVVPLLVLPLLVEAATVVGVAAGASVAIGVVAVDVAVGAIVVFAIRVSAGALVVVAVDAAVVRLSQRPVWLRRAGPRPAG